MKNKIIIGVISIFLTNLGGAADWRNARNITHAQKRQLISAQHRYDMLPEGQKICYFNPSDQSFGGAAEHIVFKLVARATTLPSYSAFLEATHIGYLARSNPGDEEAQKNAMNDYTNLVSALYPFTEATKHCSP